MSNKVQKTNCNESAKKIDTELKQKIESKLFSRGVTSASEATAEQLYLATVYAMKDMINQNRNSFKKRIKAAEGKKV